MAFLLLIGLGVLPWVAAEWCQRRRSAVRPAVSRAPEPQRHVPPWDVDGWVHEQRHSRGG